MKVLSEPTTLKKSENCLSTILIFKVLQNTPWKSSNQQLAYQWIWILCHVANIHAKHWDSHTIHNRPIAKCTSSRKQLQTVYWWGKLYWLQKNTSLWRYVFSVFIQKSFQYEREVRIISDVAESNITLNDGLKLMWT
jgi:hypothetical protein